MLDAKSKYRLIGAGLFIASSAVLLPLVLDGERPQELDVDMSVPEKPAFADVKVAPAQPVEELQQAFEEERSANDIELISEPKPASPPKARTEPKSESSVEVPAPKPTAKPKPAEPRKVVPVGDRWTLQVATFGQKANAERTLKKLKEAGYPAYVMTSNSLFKVFVGPELERSASEKVKTQVQQEFKLNGIVVKYSSNS